jgi:hypothetical protein
VENKLENVMTRAVDRIPSLPPFPHPHRAPTLTFTIGEGLLQKLVEEKIVKEEPLQDPVVHIDQQGVHLAFTLHLKFFPIPLAGAVSFQPALDNQGKLVAHEVRVSGIASVALTPDSLTRLLNRHFLDALTKLHTSLSWIDVQQGSVSITLQ